MNFMHLNMNEHTYMIVVLLRVLYSRMYSSRLRKSSHLRHSAVVNRVLRHRPNTFKFIYVCTHSLPGAQLLMERD